MPSIYWEDFVAGSVTDYGPRRVTREEIIDFALQFDPQPMHLDEEAARSSMLGGLCASGWHMCGLAMRMIVDGILRDSASMGAPGVDEVRWVKPLRPGDDITLRTTVLDTRVSRSRPEMGLINFRFELIDRHEATIMTMASSLMMGRRPTDAVA